jgi:selenide,water dikinase
MRFLAKNQWIDGAIESMLLSNQAAATCLMEYGVTACTDITGFGLLGHLMEMVKASNVSVELHLDAIPILQGARETFKGEYLVLCILKTPIFALYRYMKSLATS